MNKKFLAITITLFAVFGFLLVGEVEAGQEHNVSGWAWSENIGWISFNCTNQGTCGTANYGVNINSDGTFSGYAWSEHIGWITFNESELTNCPIAPCQTKLDLSTKQISGWAKALTDGGGWDGWIRLRDTNYGVWIDTNVSPAEFRNWAWSDMVIGWISFNCSNQGVCGTSNYKVITSFSSNNPPNAAMSCQIVDCKGPGCECNGAWTTFNGDGVIYRINNDSTDPDDNIVKSTWSIVGYQDPYFSCSSPNPLCNLTLPKIPKGDYTIKLTVEDEGGLSDTTSHPIKVKQDAIADFDCSLDGEDWATACENLIVNQGQLIYLKDKSTPSEGASIISRTWKINNVVFDSGNNAPTSVNLAESENTITLVIGDSQGRSDSEDKTIEARLPLPEYKEVPPTIWLKKFFAGIINFFDGFLKI
ncbi:MAG: hypothetical protein Q8N73_02680 [bacterium]|nr:hypothetical protein [bacterium]